MAKRRRAPRRAPRRTSNNQFASEFIKNTLIALAVVFVAFFILAGGVVLSVPDGNGGIVYKQRNFLSEAKNFSAEEWCKLRTEAGRASTGDPNYVAVYCRPGETIPQSWLDQPIVELNPIIISIPTAIP